MTKIFVFGSNLQGIHGAGAAKWAKLKFGAIQGQGEGRHGDSYAIPTKITPWQRMSLEQIKPHVETFLAYAEANPDLTFVVTRVGCGLAGYTDNDIAPMFSLAPANCWLPMPWRSNKTP